MNTMSSLMQFYNEKKEFTPSRAMEQWNQIQSQNPNLAQVAQAAQARSMHAGHPLQQPLQPGMAPGVRTPSNMPPGMPPNHQFMSPAMQTQMLPNGVGSPHLMQQNHTPSPASHPMVAQHSQSSNTASMNTSPSINNKRRRSTAKMDGDDGGGDMNGAPKVKASPRVGGNKRIKGGN
jgi:hypothetical protein